MFVALLVFYWPLIFRTAESWINLLRAVYSRPFLFAEGQKPFWVLARLRDELQDLGPVFLPLNFCRISCLLGTFLQLANIVSVAVDGEE